MKGKTKGTIRFDRPQRSGKCAFNCIERLCIFKLDGANGISLQRIDSWESAELKSKMENTTLVCSAQGWCGPNISTFSSEWDDNVNSFLKAPDVIKPPPQFQDPEETSQTSATNSAAVMRRDKDCMKKERRSRPISNIELHRRSLSLFATVNSNPGVARRRCESYALSYPSSSSEDSGSDSTSRRGGRLPDAVPRSRSRSIILKKAKTKPAPPVRTVSLQRLAAENDSEQKLQGLPLKKDGRNIMILPDLIPTSKQGVSKSKKPTAEAPGKTLKTSVSSHRALNELRSSEPCKSMPTTINGSTVGNYEMNTSPSSSHSSPSQPCISSPSKRFGTNSPSSGYASQCETPTQSQLGGRMRHKPSSVIPNQRVRNRNARLSLQLPDLHQHSPDPEPSVAQPKVNRRYSDSTEATRPKQRMSNSLMIMPVVTQEDLNSVRLRSVSSSDLENSQETTADAIEEEISLSPANHQKAKPPVAPKPQRNKWPPMAQTRFGTTSDPEPATVKPSERPQDIYAMINKVKPTVPVPSDRAHHLKQQKDCYISEGHSPRPQNPNVLPFSTTTGSNQHGLPKKRRAPPPPLKKTPAVDNTLYYNSPAQKSPDDSLSPSKLKSPKSPISASQYHVTLYGVIPSYPMATEQQHSNAIDEPTYDVEKREQMPDLGSLQLVGEEDDVFLYKSKSQTTEDLFTIIHRSKRKLLGRKDSFENKQGDPGTQTLGSGASKISSQNDNFMAFLRRTRSAKASCSERISATELLRSSKPTANIAANMTHRKNSYVQSHGP
ncbi:NHS-like protein 2 isoform X1 [Carassius auratus]|uniref:NHS-like protein 2 isoform X1 n=2 Tax=Carassius auratus TaxID=7957 RepID=A0A6P6IU98_CARAU|nr:NHS-like protein 2 isoform X1 [Carassius auratus]XP_026051370.1 NHS-like protein 2 isoform X1 [Carassius auratus]